MSAKWDNILMWSHYAESHRGFCIGFEIDKIDLLRENIWIRSGESILIDRLKVVYEEKPPTLNPVTTDSNEFMRTHVSTKSNDWKYEKEYRMILMNKNQEPLSPDDRKIKISDDFISKLIFGCRMPDDHKREILQILKEKGTIDKVDILEAKIVKKRFELDIQETPEDEIEMLLNS